MLSYKQVGCARVVPRQLWLVILGGRFALYRNFPHKVAVVQPFSWVLLQVLEQDGDVDVGVVVKLGNVNWVPVLNSPPHCFSQLAYQELVAVSHV